MAEIRRRRSRVWHEEAWVPEPDPLLGQVPNSQSLNIFIYETGFKHKRPAITTKFTVPEQALPTVAAPSRSFPPGNVIRLGRIIPTHLQKAKDGLAHQSHDQPLSRVPFCLWGEESGESSQPGVIRWAVSPKMHVAVLTRRSSQRDLIW